MSSCSSLVLAWQRVVVAYCNDGPWANHAMTAVHAVRVAIRGDGIAEEHWVWKTHHNVTAANLPLFLSDGHLSALCNRIVVGMEIQVHGVAAWLRTQGSSTYHTTMYIVLQLSLYVVAWSPWSAPARLPSPSGPPPRAPPQCPWSSRWRISDCVRQQRPNKKHS